MSPLIFVLRFSDEGQSDDHSSVALPDPEEDDVEETDEFKV